MVNQASLTVIGRAGVMRGSFLSWQWSLIGDSAVGSASAGHRVRPRSRSSPSKPIHPGEDDRRAWVRAVYTHTFLFCANVFQNDCYRLP